MLCKNAKKPLIFYKMRATKRLTKLLDRFEEEVVVKAEKAKEARQVKKSAFQGS
jgi:hypothetical protein